MQNAGHCLSITKENEILHVLCTRLKEAFPGEISQKLKKSLKLRGWFLLRAGVRKQDTNKENRVRESMNSGYFGQSPS